jgi:hypothetical protein
MNSLSFSSVSVRRLHDSLDEGRFAVPKLQRAFVWNGHKAAMLLDSVYRGMPIGSLTIWDTSKSNKGLLRHTRSIIPEFRNHNRRVWFILDGQQRASVLYQVARGGEKQSGLRQTVDFDRVVFRVTGGEELPRFQYRKPAAGEWVSVPQILSPQWRRHLKGLTPAQIKRAERCRKTVLNYKVPLVRVRSESLEEARELFIRINSQGTPIRAADKAFARAAKFDLRERAEDAWNSLPGNFKGLGFEMLLQTRALLDGVPEVGERAFEAVARRWDQEIGQSPEASKRFGSLWEKQHRAVGLAIDCLRHYFYVLDDGLLPSSYMVSTLAVFFYHREAQPSPTQLSEIRKWFWATTLGQRYSGRGFRGNILQDAEFFEKLALRGSARFRLEEQIDPEELIRTVYGQRSSIADGLYCLLISRHPASLSNGESIILDDLASPANRKNKHHIFPKGLLIRAGVSRKRANSIVNLCFIPSADNLSYGSRAPAAYLDQYRRRRYFRRVLASHLIPCDKKSGLWEANVVQGYRMFLMARNGALCKAFNDAAGMKLFRKVE